MKKYKKYKDSGLEWIGEIPESWSIVHLKYIGEIKYGLGQPPKEKVGGLPIIRATNVFRGKISTDKLLYVDPEDIPYNRDPILKENDIIIVRSGAYTGDSAIIPKEFEGAVTGYDMTLRVNNANPKFVAFSLLSNYLLNQQLILHSLRAAQPHLNAEELGHSFLVNPPLQEQKSIAHYLDQKTTIIDALLQKTKQKIALLKEQRTAIINQAVTKGLAHLSPKEGGTKGVKMKDSGVEWIGEIPESWGLRQLKSMANITRLAGAEYTSYWETCETGEIKVLRGQNIGFNKIIKKATIDRISNELSMKLIRSRLFKGDIVFPCVGSVGNALVIEESDTWHINQNIAKITPQNMSSPFLCYFLLSHFAKYQILLFNTSDMQPSVLVGSLRRFLVPYPPVSEQSVIAEYLDEKNIELDTLLEKQKSRLHLLKEYRQSLISEVVTGKLCVHNEIPVT